MKLSIQVGSTSQTLNVFIRDSSSTTGAGLTGLAYNTASLTAYYALPRSAPVSITLATQTATGAFSSGGFVEISSSNMPGWYRLDIPDAALASGRFVDLHLKGATNMAPLPVEIELTGWSNQDAVRGGMTALPNANANGNGGLPILSVSGTTLGYVITNVTNAPTSGDFTAAMKTSLNAATPAVTVSDKTGFSLSNGSIATSTFAAGATIPRVTLADTVTTVTGLNPANLDVAVSTRLATSGYTAPANSTIASISSELAKVPKDGESHTYTNDSTAEVANVSIS